MDLRDVPEGAVPQFIIDSVTNNLAVEFRNEAASRRAAVARGAETPELAATLLEKFGYGLAKAAHIAGIPSDLMREVDQTVHEIDPKFTANRRARWASSPAAITYTVGEQSKTFGCDFTVPASDGRRTTDVLVAEIEGGTLGVSLTEHDGLATRRVAVELANQEHVQAIYKATGAFLQRHSGA